MSGHHLNAESLDTEVPMTLTPSTSPTAPSADEYYEAFDLVPGEVEKLIAEHASGKMLVLKPAITSEEERLHELARKRMRKTVEHLREQNAMVCNALQKTAQRAPREREMDAWLKLLNYEVQNMAALLGAIRRELQSGVWVEVPREETAAANNSAEASSADASVPPSRPPLPWPGYEVGPGIKRPAKELRAQLGDRSDEELWNALAYEGATRDRIAVLKDIEHELDRRGATFRGTYSSGPTQLAL